MINKQEKNDQFEWWITCIPDKILILKKRLPNEIGSKLDYTISSLDILEEYLLDNYTFDAMQTDKELWDCCASYLGRTYKKNIPNSEWFIELDNEKDIFFNVPSLKTSNNLNSPPTFIYHNLI